MAETAGGRLKFWLLEAMHDLGGAAPRKRVHDRIRARFSAEFSPEDQLPRKGRTYEAAWQNNVDSLYDRLKKQGLMVQSRQGGPWCLSEAAAREPRPAVPVEEHDLLKNFEPKSVSSRFICGDSFRIACGESGRPRRQDCSFRV